MNTPSLSSPHAPALAPKASRVARAFLIHPDKVWGVVEMARAVSISPGYSVKILDLLSGSGFIVREPEGYRLVRGRELLNEWAAVHRLGKKDSLRQFTVVSDPVQTEERFTKAARELGIPYALTLFAGSRHRAPFVRYNVVHSYIEGDPTLLFTKIRGVEVTEGGNLVLVTPHDAGVFFGSQEVNSTRVVSDVQLYLDLVGYPSRGREQAEHLLEVTLPHLAPEDSPKMHAAYHESLKVRSDADQALFARDYSKAEKLFDRHVQQLHSINTEVSRKDMDRSFLLYWMSLVQTGFQKNDPKRIDRARELFKTDTEVEAQRRKVGYNVAYVELALLAYFAALTMFAGSRDERNVYLKKAREHFTIAKSPYTESHGEVEKEAERIMARAEES